jgi:hypothetical protein
MRAWTFRNSLPVFSTRSDPGSPVTPFWTQATARYPVSSVLK